MTVNLEKRVSFADISLKEAFDKLALGTYEEKELYLQLNKCFDSLKNNPFCFIKIPKKHWPKDYVLKYGITNLWKYNLPCGWRLIYTISNNEVAIISIVLEWFSHKDYEKRFNY
jgi:Txe/YoeB family toxin of Txe-Axe toxin-antitoxin module